MARFIAVTLGGDSEDDEAFGPFSTWAAADKFVNDYNEEGVRPAYPLYVVPLEGVRLGRKLIEEARAENER